MLKLKKYLKSNHFRNDLILSVVPYLLVVVLFYSNNLHLAYFDSSLLKYLLYFSFFSFIWVIIWKKTWFYYLIYLPLSFSLSFSSLLILTQIPYKVWYFYIFSFSFLFLFGFFKKIQNVTYILITTILITQFIQGLYKYNKIKKEKFDISDHFSLSLYKKTLKKSYSVYYFLADGYTSLEALKTEDRLDNSDFVHWLEKKGFSVYKNSYSNYARTYTSMQATFEMKHHYYKDMNLNTTETPNGKYIMAGANPVMARFYNNGFSVYINHYPERFRKEEQSLKKWSGKIEKKMDIELKKQDIYWFLQYLEFIFSTRSHPFFSKNFINNSIPEKIYKLKFSPENKKIENLEMLPFYTNLLNIQDKNTKFVYLHSTLTIDPKPCIKNGKNGYRDGYIEQIECINIDIQKSIDHILKKEPLSIIILQADHGRSPDSRNRSYGDGSKVIKKYGIERYIEKGNEIKKRFGILFAVRWPKECAYLGKEKYTPINLFPRVFACLNGKKPDYKKMAKDDAYLIGIWSNDPKRKSEEVFKVIEKNKILPQFR